jgi:hypothetical protein
MRFPKHDIGGSRNDGEPVSGLGVDSRVIARGRYSTETRITPDLSM